VNEDEPDRLTWLFVLSLKPPARPLADPRASRSWDSLGWSGLLDYMLPLRVCDKDTARRIATTLD
jgi:hypothetical protein